MPSARGPVIGVFDSGFGGLTVLRALLPRIPSAHYLYLGDTARLPYGAKSQATIARYAVESALFLQQRGADSLVIACNTATALALPEIRAAVTIPVVGVIEPVVQAAQQRHPHGNVLILATAATVQSRAYAHACDAHQLHTTEKACPLLVPLVEEGWIDHAVTQDVLRIYLSEALAGATPQAVLLGCTHYPLIAAEITAMLRSLGSQAEVIDSAEATAEAIAATFSQPDKESSSSPGDLQVPRSFSFGSHSATKKEGALAPAATFECFATDSIEKFQRLGSLFLGRPIDTVRLLDLGG